LGTGNKLRVLLLIGEDVEERSLERVVLASGQVAQVQARTCSGKGENAYSACQNYAPDLVLIKGAAQRGLKNIINDFHMKVLVLDGEAREPVFCSTNSVVEFRRHPKKRNLLLIYDVVDPADYFWQNNPRNIAVSSPPHEYVSFLKEKGAYVYVIENKAPWQVRDILSRSKISLNFDKDHFKITTCGAMMLDAGTEAGEFFSTREMAVFHSKEELLDRLMFFWKHTEQREEIAQEGKSKSEIWSAWNCWGYVFERMGFPVPDFLERAKSYRLHRRLIEGMR
jgi:hypothetical protein